MKKRVLALVLTACMGIALLTGCGKQETKPSESESKQESSQVTDAAEESSEEASETPQVDISEHVTLTMYCIGDEGGVYAEDHLEALNELLTERINVSLEPYMVSWGEYKQKLPMVWASGEAYDLTYVANWIGYYDEARRGAFMDITELFPTYAPLTYAEWEEKGLIEATKVNDKIYMVPNQRNEWTTFLWTYREDLRKKYNCPEIVDMETFEIYLQAIKDNEPEMFAIGNNDNEANIFHMFLNEQDWSRPKDYEANGIFVYDLHNPTEFFNLVETPEYEEFIARQRRYYENGYWSSSLMADTTATRDNFNAGKSAAIAQNVSNCNGVYRTKQADHPDWELGIFPSDYIISGNMENISATNNGVSVGAYSKNPERAIMFLELVYQDREVHELLMEGLEGITFECDRETMTRWAPEGADSSTISTKNMGMGLGKPEWILNPVDNNPEMDALIPVFAEHTINPELAGFVFVQDELTAELAAIRTLCDEYKLPMDKGALDPAQALEKFREELKDAGADKVLEELNRQLNEYLNK